MKKIQEPDLLQDQPHRMTNNLNKHRAYRLDHPKSKTRRHYPSEESNSSISACTTLTSVSSSCSSDEFSPVSPLSTSHDVVIEGLDEKTRWTQDTNVEKPKSKNKGTIRHPPQKLAPSSQAWIRTKGSSSSSSGSHHHHGWRPCCCMSVVATTKQLIVLIIAAIIVSISVGSLIAVVLSRLSHSEVVSSSSSIVVGDRKNGEGLVGSGSLSSSDISQIDDDIEESEDMESDTYQYEELSSSEVHTSENSNLDLKEVSRLSWNMLNSNQERANSGKGASSRHRHHHSQSQQQPISSSSFSGMSGGGEVVLPSKMIFTSSSDDELDTSSNLTPNSSGESNKKKRSCCRTQKYSQVIKRDGCEPLTVMNKMCFGQCVSVWVPGLFSSFPVCKPSRSSWKTVILTCGKNRDRKKRVRIEKVRRCSCMEIDPTAASPASSKRR